MPAFLPGRFDQAVEHRPAEQGVHATAHMNRRVRFLDAGNANGMFRIDRHGFFHIGQKMERLFPSWIPDFHVDDQKRTIIHLDPHLFHRCDQIELTVFFPLQYGCEQLDHGLTANCPAFVIPDAIASDSHIDIAAERRIPEMHRRGTATPAHTADHLKRIRLLACRRIGLAFHLVLPDGGQASAVIHWRLIDSSSYPIMPADSMQSDFAFLFKRDFSLLDVRSPVEFARGAFPNSSNIPLLTDQQRSQVGTMYRRRGSEAALALGHELVSGQARNALIKCWRDFIERHPEARLYCYRGGQRSQIVQQWLREEGIEVPLVPGGYKALRTHLLSVLEEAAKLDFLVIAGMTGCGKTHLVTGLPCAIDIEGAARHRGSAFGALPLPQPSQIDFENALAIALLKLEFQSLPTLIVEDESRAVGSLAIPNVMFDRMKEAPIALIEENRETREETILNDYILSNLAAWEQHQPGRGAAILEQSLLGSLIKIRRRLGEANFQVASGLMRQALEVASDQSAALHRQWIGYLLERYYDPMYQYQLARKLPRVRFRGSREEVARWCSTYIVPARKFITY